MPWLTQLWKIITASRIAFFSALSIFGLLMFFFFYLIFSFGSNESFKDKTFVIARDPNLYPIVLGGKEKNLSAFVNEMVFKIANGSNLKVRLINIQNNRLLEQLDSGAVDAILSTMGPSAVNRPSYLFSNPIFETGPVLVVREKSNYNSINDLKGKNVGLRTGDSIFFDSTSQGLSFVNYDSYLESLEDLESDRIEAVLMPATSAYTFTQLFYPGRLKVIGRSLREEGLRLVAAKSTVNHYLIETFNRGLKAAFEDGTYDQLLVRWALTNPRGLEKK